MLSTILLAALAGCGAAAQKLDHPPLSENLDYLLKGNMDNLHPTKNEYKKWDPATIPQDCKDQAAKNGQNVADMETYNVTFTDCGDPYVMCRSKNSPVPLETFIEMFGRMPVGMRDWVRHPIALPGASSAYNAGGTIVFFDKAAGNLDVHLHETGHSLDLQGAMKGFEKGGYSSGAPFQNAYKADTNVPDNYAQTNIIEDFAQITVVSVFDKNVPGGFKGAQPKYQALSHQYTTMQADAGNQIVPGGKCNRRLAPSKPVSADGKTTSRIMSSSRLAASKSWNEFFSEKHDLIEPDLEASTEGKCNFGA